MPDLREAISGGRYARHQIHSRDKLVAWSHTRRFKTALTLARDFAGKRLLDYGCGDGTFVALTMMNEAAPALAVGAELLQHHVDDCRTRYQVESRLQFVAINDLDGAGHANRYDAVFCMEVLEHVVDWGPPFDRFTRLLAPDGKLIISVPVETGLPLIIKQAVRRVAGWRQLGYYPGSLPYSFGELAKGIRAGRAQHLTRTVLDKGDGPYHDHHGFNWMRLRERVKQDFVIEDTLASPFSWLGPHLATQAWIVARLPSSAR